MNFEHLSNLPQRERILKLLQERGPSGVFVYELTNSRPQGLGVQQYNARILELREQGHNIINKTPGHFVLVGQEEKAKVIPTLSPITIQQKLDELRKQYRLARDEQRQSDMKRIELQAKPLKMALSLHKDLFIKEVQTHLF